MRKITPEQLKEVLDRHAMWLRDEEGGEKADLSETNLFGFDLSKVRLDCANLHSADLGYAKLRMAGLTGAMLINADLTGADLTGADLTIATLRGAYLREVNFRGVNFRGADLSGADLSGADLRRADLSHAHINKVIGKTLVVIGNIGSRNSSTTYNADDDVVFCGCFRGTLDEFTRRVVANYDPGHKHRAEYDAAIQLFQIKRDSVIKDVQR